ncbi:trypsin-like serine protease [Actinoplanes sp. NPDC051633]|uniref:trypsin-like serine protease n=1 Tax=Actinoplanes sp. NPDC051633 TaxID=3155670 RepID=UPI00343F1F9C
MRAWGSALIVGGLAAGILTGSAASAVGTAEPVADGELPFVAKVTFGEERDQRSCTGVLVDSRWVATNKSCFTDGSGPVAAGTPARPATVLVGRTDLTKVTGYRVAVQSLIPHPDRNVVLAELSAAVEGVAPVKLGAAAEVGETLRIAGYGRTATEWVPDRLHASSFTVQSADASSFDVTGAAP